MAFVENVRANPAEHSKAGWDKRRMLGQTITLSFLATMIIAYTAGGERTREAVTPTLFTFGPLFILFALVALWESFPLKSPKSAIRQFYYCINRCRWDRAYAIVSDYCKDNSPRTQPDALRDGERLFQGFSQESRFAEYWARLLDRRGETSSLTIARQRFNWLGSDVLMADLELQIVRKRMWWVLLQVMFFPAAIWTRKRGREETVIPVQKLLVKVGEEWRIFNGEWQGPEERDLSWLGGTEQRQE